MTQEEMQAILEQIIDLAQELGWSSALAQNKDNHILGIYIGTPDWITSKTGSGEQKVTH